MTFAPGETEQAIALPIVDDAIREDPDPVLGLDESFLVALESGDDYRLKNSGVVEVLILDNDGDGQVTPASPGVTVSPAALTVAEGTTVTYTVRLGSEPTGTVTVTAASDNPDVTFSPATLTFAPKRCGAACDVGASASGLEPANTRAPRRGVATAATRGTRPHREVLRALAPLGPWLCGRPGLQPRPWRLQHRLSAL